METPKQKQLRRALSWVAAMAAVPALLAARAWNYPGAPGFPGYMPSHSLRWAAISAATDGWSENGVSPV